MGVVAAVAGTKGLVLTGGGARGAYQAGALKALAEICGSGPVPFPVITGISVGALNAVGLASHFGDFAGSASLVEAFWKRLRTDRVFKTGPIRDIATLSGLVASSVFPRMEHWLPNALLDSDPLRQSLARAFDFQSIQRSIERQGLRAIGLTASCYATGSAVTFFDGDSERCEWSRVRRKGRKTSLTLNHALASSALPFLFEAIEIDGQYYGDGMLRMTSPLAPAIHLGASRLMVIATHERPSKQDQCTLLPGHYPTFGDLGGYALETVFRDSIDADVERLSRINTTLNELSETARRHSSLKHIDVMILAPSCPLNDSATAARSHHMSRTLKWLLFKRQSKPSAGRLESYLSFEPDYVSAIFELGYKDTMSRRSEVEAFLQ
ncbi:patatin-like phospholipase family protein [Halomonas sp. M20]|uniref:patatin-like phospholipase family protein n=1 Tax=Halomonas sp. M20 TaxID=2763264 RepID=UPI001D0B4F7B|nr:patatin-like phospholipase family protein [Halomonas sp. M20]